MKDQIVARVNEAIERKVFPGCVIGVVTKNGARGVFPFGHFTYEPNSAHVREDTIYDVASITKSIPTASLVLLLMAEGKLQGAKLVREYLPELQNDHEATVEDLLAYRVSGPRLSVLREKTAEAMLGHIFEQGFEPRAEAKYTNLPALLLGLIVERATGDTVEHLSQARFFTPLHMERTTFFPFRDLPDKKDEIAPTEIDEWRGDVHGFPHDESAYVFAKSGRVVGHAGLFSTAPDMLNFLEALLHPAHDGDTTSIMGLIADGAQKGLGWQRAEPWFTGTHFGTGAFGKTGFTGTSVVVDPQHGIAFVILSNRTYPKRPPDAASIHSAINTFRADIADILLSA